MKINFLLVLLAVSLTAIGQNLTSPQINGSIYAIKPDGNGGYFIGGRFSQVNSQDRNNLAHLDANGQLTNFFSGQKINGDVLSLALNAGILYVGGAFSSIGGKSLSTNATQMTSSGAINESYPKINGTVQAVIPDGAGGWYICGNFTKVGDKIRNQLAQIDSSANVTSFFEGGDFSSNMCPSCPTVSSMDLNKGKLFIGGNFDFINDAKKPTTSFIKLTSKVAPDTQWPNVDGTVLVSAADGQGGILIGGQFTRVGGQPRLNLARILADGTLSPWNPSPDNSVRAIAVSGTTVYVGGNFTTINQNSRNSLAAVDLTTGTVSTWNPSTNGVVNSIAISGSSVFIGGSFSTAGGQQRNNIAAVNSVSGALLPMNANANGPVNVILVVTETRNGISQPPILYVGGNFTSIGGQPRTHATSLDAMTGSASIQMSWAPRLDGQVKSMAYAKMKGVPLMIVAGDFRYGIKHYTLPIEDWRLATGVDGTVNFVSIVDTLVYVGGTFRAAQGNPTFTSVPRKNLLVLGLGTGRVIEWNVGSSSPVNTIVEYNGDLFVGGNASKFGGAKNYAACIDLSDGSSTPWNPDPNGGVSCIDATGDKVYLTGEFTALQGKTRYKIAQVNASDGNVTLWNARFPNSFYKTIYSIKADTNNIYVGGSFDSLGGQPRNNLASLDVNKGDATSWNPSPNNTVNCLGVSGSNLFASGSFTSIAGTNRPYLACINQAGAVTAWNPSPNQTVSSFVLSPTSMFANGGFTMIGGKPRNSFAELNFTDGTAGQEVNAIGISPLAAFGSNLFVGCNDRSLFGGVTRLGLVSFAVPSGNISAWNPSVSGVVTTMAISGTNLIVGGAYSQVGSQQRNNLAAIDLNTAIPTTWNPSPNSSILALMISGNTLYTGGYFTSIGGQTRKYLASLSLSSGLATRWSPNIDGAVSALSIMDSTIYIAGAFSKVDNKPRSKLASLSISGKATKWNPLVNPNGLVNTLFTSNSIVYLGGSFNKIGTTSRTNIAALDAKTALVKTWQPAAIPPVNFIVGSGSTIYVGGVSSLITTQRP